MRAAAALAALAAAVVAAGGGPGAPPPRRFGCGRGVRITLRRVEKAGERFLVIDLPQQHVLILELRQQDGEHRLWGEPGGKPWGWRWRDTGVGRGVLSRIRLLDWKTRVMGPELSYLTECGELG
ncbi:MAG TPA: hypothetical protein PKD10_05650 [Paracoccaceae bacterium]|nr:hypothetical protein [Paracoccaceae bacterium]